MTKIRQKIIKMTKIRQVFFHNYKNTPAYIISSFSSIWRTLNCTTSFVMSNLFTISARCAFSCRRGIQRRSRRLRLDTFLLGPPSFRLNHRSRQTAQRQLIHDRLWELFMKGPIGLLVDIFAPCNTRKILQVQVHSSQNEQQMRTWEFVVLWRST